MGRRSIECRIHVEEYIVELYLTDIRSTLGFHISVHGTPKWLKAIVTKAIYFKPWLCELCHDQSSIFFFVREQTFLNIRKLDKTDQFSSVC